MRAAEHSLGLLQNGWSTHVHLLVGDGIVLHTLRYDRQ
jgi:hypothetical protein